MLWEFKYGLVFVQLAVIAAALVVQVITRQVGFASLPPPVVAAVEEQFPGASWCGAKADARSDGFVHQVTICRGRETLEVAVAPTGQVVEVERPIDPAGAPAAVRTALAGHYPAAAVRQFQEVSREGAVVGYEVVFDATYRRPTKVVFDPAGRVVSERWN